LVTLKQKARALGREIIDLGMGNPDLPTSGAILEALAKAVQNPETHRYPLTKGTPRFRKAAADFYRRRFGVSMDPETETLSLIGSKEGLGHLFFALTDPGDTVVVPSPAYPAHTNAPYLSRTKAHWAPLLEKNGYLMDFGSIPKKVLDRAKLLILNYPNNPTGAVVEDKNYLREAVRLAKKHGFLLVYDNAYSELTFDGYAAPSVLEIPGAKACSIEFNSLSKTYSMAGWRAGYCLGNAKAVGILEKFKGFIDYGAPAFIQEAAAFALDSATESALAGIYQSRRDAMLEALRAHCDWSLPRVKGSMYLWGPLPKACARWGSFQFVEKLLLATGVCYSPGVGFGKQGEGYIRISLVAPEKGLREAARRTGEFLNTLKPNRVSQKFPIPSLRAPGEAIS
jgi:LL-diaminopimelate aminotransferase